MIVTRMKLRLAAKARNGSDLRDLVWGARGAPEKPVGCTEKSDPLRSMSTVNPP
jgi:hypothetical protein